MSFHVRCAAFAVVALIALQGGRAWTQDAAAASAPVSLKYRFQEGSTLGYQISDRTQYAVQVGTFSQNVEQSAETLRHIRILSTEPTGAARIELSIAYTKMSANSDGQVLEWDSRSKTEPPAEFAGHRGTIGRPLATATILPNGEIKDVVGQADPSSQFELLPRLPTQPVAVGATWTENLTFEISPSAGLKAPDGAAAKKPINLQRLYTLRKIEGGIATIDFRTLILSPIRDPMEEGQLVTRTPSGSFQLDIERGCMTERQLKLDSQSVGFSGPQSLMRVNGLRTDTLTPAAAQAQAAAPAATR